MIVPAVPPTCSKIYSTIPTSSVLPLASNVDVEPSSIVVGLAVRLATGGWLTGGWLTSFTVTTTLSSALAPMLSITLSLNASSVSAETEGASNVAVGSGWVV